MWISVAGLAVLYLCSTLPTPLYPLYQRDFGFSELVVTAIYASYVVGNLAVLFVFGRLSDQLGRRPTTLLAFGIVGASALCFLLATSSAWLYVARILNGLAAGLGAGALTAWIAELEPAGDKMRAATVASAGNLGGLGLGALIAGVLAQYAPWPLRTSYVFYLLMLLTMAILIRVPPEGLRHAVQKTRDVSLRPRIGVPRAIRAAFIAPAAMAFTTFALGGFYGALTPGVLSQSLHQHNLAVTGGIVALFFGVGGLAAAISGKLRLRPAMLLATATLLIGLGLLVATERLRSMPMLESATLVSGIAIGVGFRASLQIINEIAPEAHRAEIISSYLLVCYTANSLPVIGIGLLTLTISAPDAHLIFALILALLAVIACATGWKFIAKR